MRFGRYVLPLVVLIVIMIASPAVYGVNIRVGTPVDDISFSDKEGRSFHLEEFKGKVVLLTFWSTWCERCRDELTFLKENFGDMDELVIIAVNQDSDKKVYRSRVEKFVKRIGAEDFKLVFDEGYELWDRLGINALPTSIIIDREGKVTHIEPNFYFASPDNFKRVIGKLLLTEGS